MRLLDVASRRFTIGTASLLSLSLGLAACGDSKAPGSSGPGASAGASANTPSAVASPAASAVAAPPAPKALPHFLVDVDGPSIGGKRFGIGPGTTDREALARAVKELPVEGKELTLAADRKAKTGDVLALVGALGEAGASALLLRTEGRPDLPKEVRVTPVERLSAPPGCSLVALAQKDLGTALSSVQGGAPRLVGKGLGGPDLTRVGDDVRSRIGSCASSVALVGGDDALGWETTFNLLGTVASADAASGKKKLGQLAVLRSLPAAGKPIALGSR